MNQQTVQDAMRVLDESPSYQERYAALRTICKETVRKTPTDAREECQSFSECHNLRHHDSARYYCALHERERAINEMQNAPFDMVLQAEVGLWTAQAIKAGQFKFEGDK